MGDYGTPRGLKVTYSTARGLRSWGFPGFIGYEAALMLFGFVGLRRSGARNPERYTLGFKCLGFIRARIL